MKRLLVVLGLFFALTFAFFSFVGVHDAHGWQIEHTLRRPEFPMNIQAPFPPGMDDIYSGEGFMTDASRWRVLYLLPSVKFCIVDGDDVSCATPPPGSVLLIPVVLPDSL